jgi:hypothetical protein
VGNERNKLHSWPNRRKAVSVEKIILVTLGKVTFISTIFQFPFYETGV